MLGGAVGSVIALTRRTTSATDNPKPGPATNSQTVITTV
jgi:hypothetical protein